MVNSHGSRSRTTKVEGPHGQLSARLANGLGGNDTDRLAKVDDGPARQIAAIAGCANSIARFTGNRRAHQHPVDAGCLKLLYPLFVKQGSAGAKHLVAVDGIDVLGRYPAQYPHTQRRKSTRLNSS